MATGGIFTLITNDGKQDRMLMASALLEERMAAVKAYKKSVNGGELSDPQNQPTLLDIEKTHVLFTNAHFKPFAAIGFEYNKVQPNGTATLGSVVTFSIPQFGDLFHDICCHVILKQPTLTNDGSAVTSTQPLMRWCSFPGERLLKKVTQEVNGNPLDEYTSHATNMHREFRVAPNKRLGWDRCVGQEVPEQGFVRQPDWLSNGVAASAVTHRIQASVCVGNQTPTAQKDQTTAGNLELFIPLLFWYNKDVRLAVPSVAIPFGQRYINLELASLDELVGVVPRGATTLDWSAPLGTLSEPVPTVSKIELYINNIFMNSEIHTIYIKRIGFSLIRVHRQQIYNATSSSAEVLLQQLKWPVEFLFVGMKVKNYWNSSSAADKRQYLDQWHAFSSISDQSYKTTGQNTWQTANLMVGSGTLAVAITTGTATTGTAVTAVAVAAGDLLLINGQLFTATSVLNAGSPAASTFTVLPVPATAISATTDVKKVVAQGLEIQTERRAKTVDNITIKVHGISMYDNLPSSFFNAYTPYHYGGPNINTPNDVGALLIPFCLYPGTYQPSGHINVSRAREFYINYDSSVINSSVEGSLVVIASAINFLLISDGSAVLRYST